MGLLHPSFLPKNAQKRKSIGARRKDRSGGDSNFFSLGAPFSLGAAVNYPSLSGCPANTAAKGERDQTSKATCGFASFFPRRYFFQPQHFKKLPSPPPPFHSSHTMAKPRFLSCHRLCKGQSRYPVITGSAMFSCSPIDWIKFECVGTGSGLLHTILCLRGSTCPS